MTDRPEGSILKEPPQKSPLRVLILNDAAGARLIKHHLDRQGQPMHIDEVYANDEAQRTLQETGRTDKAYDAIFASSHMVGGQNAFDIAVRMQALSPSTNFVLVADHVAAGNFRERFAGTGTRVFGVNQIVDMSQLGAEIPQVLPKIREFKQQQSLLPRK